MTHSDFIDELIKKRDALEKYLEGRLRELQQLNTAINSLQGTPSVRYNWSEEAVESIKREGRFLQTTEILEYCLCGSEDLQDEKKRRNALVGISVALNNLCSKGFLRKIVLQGVKGHFYGFPEWFEDDKSPKKEHVANLMVRYGKMNLPLKLDTNQLTLMQAALLEG